MIKSNTFRTGAISLILAAGFSANSAVAHHIGMAHIEAARVQTQADQPAREVTVSINDVFVPGGFDADADAYVVVNGIFPNSCYRWSKAEVKNVSDLQHEVKSKAMVSQGLCLMVMVPFTKEVRLGKLASGEHTLKFLNGDGTYMEKTLKVE